MPGPAAPYGAQTLHTRAGGTKLNPAAPSGARARENQEKAAQAAFSVLTGEGGAPLPA